jgi:hypothetical protein
VVGRNRGPINDLPAAATVRQIVVADDRQTDRATVTAAVRATALRDWASGTVLTIGQE